MIAMVYASVGFGGGSSYLALLAQPMFLMAPEMIRPTALLCNIIVVTGSTILFYKDKKIAWREVWPFFVTSVPLAFVGGLIKLEQNNFFVLLGIVLVVAAVALWIKSGETVARSVGFTPSFGMVIGGMLGFLSGLLGIGGGVFLSPILHFFNWSDARKISALASLYILVNSASGLIGQMSSGVGALSWKFLLPLLLAVFVGGQIGTRLGLKKFNPVHIKRITALLIFYAGCNILWKHMA